MTPEDKIAVANNQHDRWRRRLEDQGILTRPAAWDGGEELMTPWTRLSLRARKWNMEGLDDCIASLDEAGFVVVPADAVRRLTAAARVLADELAAPDATIEADMRAPCAPEA